MSRAVVLGGGFAGVLAAAALAGVPGAPGVAGEVVVIEGDRYPAAPGPRRGLPQAHHSHVLVAGGARALAELLPGTLEELAALGARRIGLPGDALILTAEGWFRRLDTAAYLVSCSRGLLDHVIRPRALASGTITVRQGVTVTGLTGDAHRVTGVRVEGRGREEVIHADLVVDATGRRSGAPRWLAELGVGEIPEQSVSSGLAYATRVYRAPDGLDAGMPAVMLHPRPSPGEPGRGATVYPIEGGRWIVTLTGTEGGRPPADERGFEEFARALHDPIVAELMAAATPLGRVRPYHDTANRRRFFERASVPDGFVAVGDAVVAVNPIYSHGMSVAVLSALAIRSELARSGLDCARVLRAAVAEVAETSWRMAVEQESGPGPATPFQRQVRLRRTRAALASAELAGEMFGRQTLLPDAAASRDRSWLLRVMSEPPGAPLTTGEAIRQFPRLSGWWPGR